MSRPGPTGPALRGLFVTGTDTGVGKTTIATALLRCARRRGLHPVAYKPAETGCDPDPLDARALWEAAAAPVTLDEVCPFPLRLPAAPALAAAHAGVRLDLDKLADRGRALAAAGDFLLVEGAGGLLVPYDETRTAADLAARLGLPLLVVARTALGTVNHTALTVREAARQGLDVAGVIFNRTTATPGPHESGNADLVEALTGLRVLGTFPHLESPTLANPEQCADLLADCLRPAGLDGPEVRSGSGMFGNARTPGRHTGASSISDPTFLGIRILASWRPGVSTFRVNPERSSGRMH